MARDLFCCPQIGGGCSTTTMMKRFSLAVRRATGKLFTVQSLTPLDSHHLEAAQGWLELGNHLEANEELEKISPAMRGNIVIM